MKRPLDDILDDLVSYAPNGGGAWQTVGMRAVPVALLTELAEAMRRG